jgi:hypothetical protein
MGRRLRFKAGIKLIPRQTGRPDGAAPRTCPNSTEACLIPTEPYLIPTAAAKPPARRPVSREKPAKTRAPRAFHRRRLRIAARLPKVFHVKQF